MIKFDHSSNARRPPRVITRTALWKKRTALAARSPLGQRIVSPEQHDFPRSSKQLADTLRGLLVVGDVHVEDVRPWSRSRGPRLDPREVDAVLLEHAED